MTFKIHQECHVNPNGNVIYHIMSRIVTAPGGQFPPRLLVQPNDLGAVLAKTDGVFCYFNFCLLLFGSSLDVSFFGPRSSFTFDTNGGYRKQLGHQQMRQPTNRQQTTIPSEGIKRLYLSYNAQPAIRLYDSGFP
jgi:hypothetical protein